MAQVGEDDAVSESDVETDVTPVIAELVRGTIARSERVDRGSPNRVHRIELADGRVLGVKRYARGRSYAVEGAALRELAGAVPVPEIVCTLDRVIAYRWIDGLTLESALELPSQRAALAAPLGQLLGTLARIRRDARPIELAPTLAHLERGPARARLGADLADALHRQIRAQRFDAPTCFVHGKLDAHNVIVSASLDRIVGVVDWDTATAGSIFLDVGSLFRRPHSFDAAFIATFERAHGCLPAGWLRSARLLDAARLVAELAEDRERPLLYDDLRATIAELVASDGR